MRKQIQAQIKGLSPADRRIRTEKIGQRFFDIFKPIIFKGLRVALFRPLTTEVGLEEIEHQLFNQGALLHYPRVENQNLEFYRVEVPSEQKWEVGALGVQQPPDNLVKIHPENLDFCIVPGLIFGPQGQRIGRGKGYYDRFLPRAPQALRVALCFDVQWVSDAPNPKNAGFSPMIQPHDVPMDALVSENRNWNNLETRWKDWFSKRGFSTPSL